jgi:hypothetical protein
MRHIKKISLLYDKQKFTNPKPSLSLTLVSSGEDSRLFPLFEGPHGGPSKSSPELLRVCFKGLDIHAQITDIIV